MVSDGAVGAGALKWSQPLKDPGEECPRQREGQEQRAPYPGGCACRACCTHGKGVETEARTSRREAQEAARPRPTLPKS